MRRFDDTAHAAPGMAVVVDLAPLPAHREPPWTLAGAGKRRSGENESPSNLALFLLVLLFGSTREQGDESQIRR